MFFGKILNLLRLLGPAALVLALFPAREALSQLPTPNGAKFVWQEIEPGFALTKYSLGKKSSVIRSHVLLLKFDLRFFSLKALLASDLGKSKTDIQTLAAASDGIAAINANFFDPNGKALGLIVSSGVEFNRMHRGGNVLTGVFFVKNNTPSIVHRTEFKAENAQLAIQSGPRLLAEGKALKLSSSKATSRRSGIAVTRKNEVIIYATVLRFPGASLTQIQEMLLHPGLEIKEALNLDGGGSSQLYIRKNAVTAEDIFVSGGDLVPVGLVVERMSR